MTPSTRTATLFITLAFCALGAGCFDLLQTSDRPAEPGIIQSAFEEGEGSFGEASTSTTGRQTPEKRWDVTQMKGQHVAFSPPSGTWVYYSELHGRYYLVPGAPPDPDAPDPTEAVLDTYIAEMYPVQRDPTSFPTWDRFTVTMAQFDCSEGDTEETFIVCLDTKSNVQTGTTEVGLPYERFTIQAVRNSDQAPRGPRTYIITKLGNASDYAILIVPRGEANADTATDLAKNMRILAIM